MDVCSCLRRKPSNVWRDGVPLARGCIPVYRCVQCTVWRSHRGSPTFVPAYSDGMVATGDSSMETLHMLCSGTRLVCLCEVQLTSCERLLGYPPQASTAYVVPQARAPGREGRHPCTAVIYNLHPLAGYPQMDVGPPYCGWEPTSMASVPRTVLLAPCSPFLAALRSLSYHRPRHSGVVNLASFPSQLPKHNYVFSSHTFT